MDELRKREETRQQKLKKAREDLAAAELELESLNPYELPRDELVSVLLVIGYITHTHTHTTTTTTKPYPTKWGRLHGSNYAIVFYHKPNLDPTH